MKTKEIPAESIAGEYLGKKLPGRCNPGEYGLRGREIISLPDPRGLKLSTRFIRGGSK